MQDPEQGGAPPSSSPSATAGVTFLATLGFAPHLDTGILVGAGLGVILYLYRRMKARVARLGRHPDGTLRDARLHQLPTVRYVAAVRFDGSLYFANVSYFMVFSGLKNQVVTVLERTGLHAEMGEGSFFRTEEMALGSIYRTVADPSVDAAFRPKVDHAGSVNTDKD